MAKRGVAQGIGLRALVAVAMVLPSILVGCSSGPAPTVAVQSPVDTVYSFFKALNSGDIRLADAFLSADSTLPRGGDAPPSDEFSNLTCHPASQTNPDIVDTDTRAVVACEFDIREDWSGFSAIHYGWGVWLERQPPGPWLVYDWGQG